MSDSQQTPTLDSATTSPEAEAAEAAKAAKRGCGVPVDLDFSTFVVSIGTSALVGLGMAENPETGTRSVDLDLAQQNIDILAMLCHKTQGNLDDAESKLLRTMLYDLRLAFVKVRG